MLAINLPAAIAQEVRAQEAWRATPWVKAASSEVRLIMPAQTLSAGATVHAAIEIRLPPDAKTYWRTAGETGVPPAFNFAASSGASRPEVRFPAPTAFDDGVGGQAYGYIERAILPVRFTADGPSGRLAVTVDYGVCLKAMCVPAQASLSAEFGGGEGDAALSTEMAQLLAALPKPAGLGATGQTALTAVHVARRDKKTLLQLRLRANSGTKAQVFIEAEESFTIASTRALPSGEIEILAKAMNSGDASKPLGEVRLTLVDGVDAIEVSASLDQALVEAKKAGVTILPP